MSDTAKKIAKNIVALAEHLLANDGAFDVQHYEAYDYSTLLFSLRLASGNMTSDLFKNGEPKEADRQLARKIMGADAPDLERVYWATIELVAPYLLNHAWAKMTECDFSADNDHYAHFHILREKCGYAPYSEELLSFLNVPEGKYRFIDRQNALQEIYKVTVGQLRAFDEDILAQQTIHSAKDGSPTTLETKLNALFNNSANQFIDAIQDIATQSRLTDEEVERFLRLSSGEEEQQPIPTPNDDGPMLH